MALMVKGGLFDGAGSEAEDDEQEESTTNIKFLRLPYGLAKERGLNTDGLRPREVWDLLKGMGIDPQTEMGKLADELNKNEPDQSKHITNEQIIQELKKQRVNIADTFSSVDEKLQSMNLQQLGKLVEKHNTKEFGTLLISSHISPKETKAYYQYPLEMDLYKIMNRYNRMVGDIKDEDGRGTISFNLKYFSKIEKEAEGRDFSKDNHVGWNGRCDDANKHVYTLSHEYGHRVTHAGLIKLYKENTKRYNDIYAKEEDYSFKHWGVGRYSKEQRQRLQNAILNDMVWGIRDEYKKLGGRGIPREISGYGKIKTGANKSSSTHEWIAEGYAEAQCSSDARPIAKAIDNYFTKMFGKKG